MISKTIWIGAVRHLAFAIVAGCMTIAALSTAGAQTPDKARHMIEDVRDARYCELFRWCAAAFISSPPSTTRSG